MKHNKKNPSKLLQIRLSPEELRFVRSVIKRSELTQRSWVLDKAGWGKKR